MTHLLPGGGVPRVHGARSPVPPRFPLFATPRSVHHLAAVAAGAYPPRRPPNAWSPRVPALPGPCYWLVASGTPLGWHGGCLAAALVRGAVRYYCLGGCSALLVCARRSRPVQGGWGRCQVVCLLRFPLLAPRFPRCVWRAVPSRCPVSSLAGTPFHAVCAFRGLGPVALLVFPACPLCVCALALSRRPPPPPPWVGVARAPRAVLVLGAGRAVPRGPWPSPCPASVPCPVWLACGGGVARSRSPCAWLGVVCPPLGGPARPERSSAEGGGGGGRSVCRPPRRCGRGAPRSGWSPYLGPSLCLPWAGNKAGVIGVALVMEGGAPILLRFVFACCPRAWPVWRRCALARVRLPVAAPVGAGGGGHGGAWRTGSAAFPSPGAAALSGGGGTSPLPWGGWRAGAPVARLRHFAGRRGGVEGEGRGGRAVVPHLPPPGGWPVAPGPDPPSLLAHPPQVYLFGRGRSAAPGAGGSVRRGGGGRCAAPPRGLGRGAPQGGGREGCLAAVCFSALPGTKAGRFVCAPPSTLHWLTSECRRPPAAHGAPLRAGTGLPACRGHCGTGRAADWRHGANGSACRGSGAPPWVSRPSQGGGSPLGPGGGGVGPLFPWPSSGCPRVGGGEGGGGAGRRRLLPAVPLRSPGATPRRLRGGGLVVPAPGGQPLTGGGALLSCPPPTFGPYAVVWALAPGPPAPLAAAASPRGAGGWGGGGEGRRVLGPAVRVSG